MQDFQKIHKYQGERFDRSLYEVFPFLGESQSNYLLLGSSVESSSSSPSLIGASQDIGLPPIFVPTDNRSQSKSSPPEANISTGSEINRQTIIPHRLQPEIEAFQSSSQSEYGVDEWPKIRKRTQRYEANNLLPKARKPHLQFLKKRLQEKIYSHKIINKLKRANTATRQDFLELYNIPEFQDAFEEFFTNKVLYRAVMTSVCKMRNKKVFIRRLHIFQEAFRTKIFNDIQKQHFWISMICSNILLLRNPKDLISVKCQKLIQVSSEIFDERIVDPTFFDKQNILVV